MRVAGREAGRVRLGAGGAVAGDDSLQGRGAVYDGHGDVGRGRLDDERQAVGFETEGQVTADVVRGLVILCVTHRVV